MTGTHPVGPSTHALLSDLGIDTASVLRRAGLPGDLFARGAVRLDARDYFAFCQAIQDEAGDLEIPVRIASTLSAELFDPPVFAALMSPNLETAAARVSRYKSLLGDVRLDVDVEDDAIRLTYVWPAEQRAPQVLVLSELLFWVALARMGTRHEIHPLQVQAPEPPEDSVLYRSYLGIDIETADIASVSFSHVDARRPFLTANDTMWAAFEPQLVARLSDLAGDAATSERVRAVLREMLPAGESGLDAVARQLATSSRSLHRRLAAEGTTFQEVLNATREGLARHYLTQPDINVDDIAFLLGYREVSSFYRAFRSWTGATPQQVRRQTG